MLIFYTLVIIHSCSTKGKQGKARHIGFATGPARRRHWAGSLSQIGGQALGGGLSTLERRQSASKQAIEQATRRTSHAAHERHLSKVGFLRDVETQGKARQGKARQDKTRQDTTEVQDTTESADPDLIRPASLILSLPGPATTMTDLWRVSISIRTVTPYEYVHGKRRQQQGQPR